MITADNVKALAIGGVALAGCFVAYKAYTKAAAIGGGVVDAIAAAPAAAVEVAVGSVEGIGEVFGIPKTSMTQCEQDIAAGRTWDSSFSCSAGTFLGSLFGSKPSNTDTGNGYDSSGNRAGVRYDSAGNVIGVY